ncbi:MAG: acetyl-CoA carboxylase biotin carboxyl carrier protein subunit [Bacteroidales bacterium]|nr:acetyl-CoA carboxylase biotin carboxyl carrier protein subunit [Bacteroidales bacterium]MBR2607882.1 acetyl-CoA carboxylase biotin carboxyl carrier protein subunit [Bacteroidaceae bacterium]
MKEYKYKINGENYNVTINEVNDTTAQVEVNGVAYNVEWEKPEAPKPVVISKPVASAAKPAAAPTAAPAPIATNAAGGYAIKTPLPGVIIDIKVNVGDTVAKGQTVAILEAMKMENNINSDRDGKVASIAVSKGETVADGAVLITLE